MCTKDSMKFKKKHTPFWLTVIAMTVSTLIFNLIAWNSSTFCDGYIRYLFPFFQNTYGRFSSLFPFSIGEYMIIAGIILVILALLFALFLGVLTMISKLHKSVGKAFRRFHAGYSHFCSGYYRFFAGVLCFVMIIMTLNCTFLYHASPLDPNPQKKSRQYTWEELEILRNYIVEKCLTLSEEMDRDETGYIMYNEDLRTQAKAAMAALSGTYPNLSGFYPNTKYMLFSGLMSQSDMCGYYFPFSLETNVNSYMHIMNYPFSICHELAHFKGYIYEYDANFLAYLACVSNSDPAFQYSGYLNVLNYVNNDYYGYLSSRDLDRYYEQPAITEQIRDDNAFLAPGMWEKVEEHAILSTDMVNAASDTFVEASLQFNGIDEGMVSYSEVVGKLLEYYDGVLY